MISKLIAWLQYLVKTFRWHIAVLVRSTFTSDYFSENSQKLGQLSIWFGSQLQLSSADWAVCRKLRPADGSRLLVEFKEFWSCDDIYPFHRWKDYIRSERNQWIINTGSVLVFFLCLPAIPSVWSSIYPIASWNVGIGSFIVPGLPQVLAGNLIALASRKPHL